MTLLGIVAARSADAVELDAFSLAHGKAYGVVDVDKIGARKNFSRVWSDTPNLRISGYWEASVGNWRYRRDNVVTVALSPVFTFEYWPSNAHLHPYSDIGIGLTVISDQMIEHRNMSSPMQFEDQIGVGVRFGHSNQHDLNLRFLHYSNANIVEPNNGITIFLATYTFWLRPR